MNVQQQMVAGSWKKIYQARLARMRDFEKRASQNLARGPGEPDKKKIRSTWQYTSTRKSG